MKTLVFYILNGISFNAQNFFIRQLAASGSDLFGLKFYAPWVMRLIKLHFAINYQPSARNHLIFLLEVDMSIEAEPIYLHNIDRQSFTQLIEGVHAATRVYPLAGNTRAPHRVHTEATESTIAQSLGRDLVYSMTESFSWPCIRNKISIITGSSVKCRVSWWMLITFVI